MKIFKIAYTLTERVLKIQEFQERLSGRLSADDVRIGAIRTLYAEIIGISRVPFAPPSCPPSRADPPVVHRCGFPFPPLSRPGFLALQPERLATSSSGDEDDVRRRRDQHVSTALPSGNYRKPRLSEEATLAHPFFPLSFSFLRCILSSFGFPLPHLFFVRFSRLLST